jgi:hypothetical protein
VVATFDTEQQLRTYVRWEKLSKDGDNRGTFEHGIALASCESWEKSSQQLTDEDAANFAHNPDPSML